MKSQKTVAIFSAYTVPHLGGIERYTDNLTKQFVQMGITPIVITTNFNNSEQKTEENGVTFLRLPIYSMFKNRYPIIKKDKEYKEVMARLNEYSIDAIIVNTRFHLTSHVGATYGTKHNIPVYLIEHGSNYVTLDNKFVDFFANRYEDYLTWRIKNKIKGFYGVSRAAGEWLKHLGITYSGVWYNSIDCDQEIPQRQVHAGTHYLYAGRLIKQKGVENVLISFEAMLKKYSDIDLVIAGDGPELQQYKERFQSEKIHFVGKLNYEQLSEFYSDTDVFLYPPLWPEGLPTSILEAGLMGCCVIGTNQGGIKEIIQDKKTGLIVDNTATSLQTAMEELYMDKDLCKKYADQLKQCIICDFSWKATSEKVAKDIGVL